ncbi:hypothetical protein V5F32_00985 [Xanthobacter oligotrophicus]|uniref:Phosphohydrolase n=1 Tax=Xanthobacter oligotrophicus TaxID=2607286 RepID=A0ABW6ZQI8_9HYPH
MSDFWIQTGTGRALDLMSPTAAMIDLEQDVAEALAREPRFGGHVRSGPYSVAQHCVLGADCIERATGSVAVARAFLLHDAHEAYCKDIMTPLARALDARVYARILHRLGQRVPNIRPEVEEAVAAGVFADVLKGLKADLDRAIHEAAGHPWPLDPTIATKVAEWDLAMIAAERVHLMARAPKPWAASVERAAPARIAGRIAVWPWPKAADEWRARLHKYFPNLAAKARPSAA